MDSPMASMNHRAGPRVPASSHLWVQCRRGVPGQGADLANGLLDLSEGGLQFLCREPLACGETVEVLLAGGSAASILCRRGVVRWVIELSAGACFAGVQFHEPLADADLRALAEIDAAPLAS